MCVLFLSCYAKGGKWDLAMDVFWEMRDADVIMDVVTFRYAHPIALLVAATEGERTGSPVGGFYIACSSHQDPRQPGLCCILRFK